MSCIELNISPTYNDSHINASISRIGEGAELEVKEIGERIQADTREISERLLLNTQAIGERLSISVKEFGEKLYAGVLEISKRLLAETANLSEGLKVRCSIICSLADVGSYLEVSPADIQWITDDMGVYFDVESNVEWIIVTS